jgi:hypothetical protein
MSKDSVARLPFLHDHHSHVSLYAAFEGLPDLSGLGESAAMDLLRALPGDRLSVVKGWRTERLDLGPETLVDMPPAIIVNSSLHGFSVAPSALPFIERAWPELAERAGDAAWGERNLPRLFVFYGKAAGLDIPKLESFMSRVESLGLWSLEDMTLAGEDALDLVSSSRFADRIVPWATPDVYRGLSPKSRRKCAGIKLFLDGSLGARSAALDAPFSGGEKGRLLYGDEELSSILTEISGYGAGLSAHAIGHAAIEQALRCLGRLAEAGIGFPFVRLEHVQFISLAQARRCKESGIVLSMQPNFNSDSKDYADRLIPRHRAENDPFRMLIDEAGFVPGKDLVFGSDGMPHGPEYGLRWSLFPDLEGQRLSLEEFIAGYSRRDDRAKPPEGEGSAFSIDEDSRNVRKCLPAAGG